LFAFLSDTLVRQATMICKCFLLMYYKNSRGQNYRRQGQMLTLVEYLLLLYRALLPTPVWYRFLLNKEYGSLFSSLMTGLYLTFKLTSIVEKLSTQIPSTASSAGINARTSPKKPSIGHKKPLEAHGLRWSERAHYAGLWSNLRILDHLAMDQLVCFSSCYKRFCCKREFFCFEALNPYAKQPSPDIFIYTGNLTIICFALFTGSTGKLLVVPRIELNCQYVHICIEKG
ncbi:hypothetical protein CFP56_010378, partial [Quercus suber]